MEPYRLICHPEQGEIFQDFFEDIQTSPFSQHLVCNGKTGGANQEVERLKQKLNHEGITCVYVPIRKIQACFFDMDGTAIAQETINELAKLADKEQEVAKITSQAMSGEIDFEQALRERVRSLAGLNDHQLEKVHDSLTINPGLAEFSSFAAERSIRRYLVSGGFLPFAERIAKTLSFDGCHANQLQSINACLNGELQGILVDGEEKARFLLERCSKDEVNTNNTMAIGDGANDLSMMAKAGLAIGFHPKKVIIDHCHGAIFSDHRILMDIIN